MKMRMGVAAVLLLATMAIHAAPLANVASFEHDYESDQSQIPGTTPSSTHSTAGNDGESTALVLPDGDEDSENDPLLEGAIPAETIRRTEHLIKPSPIPKHLMDEERAPTVTARSVDARQDMKPLVDTPLDEDCDSPQIGESEEWPIKGGIVQMNKIDEVSMKNDVTGVMSEQDTEREVLSDHQSYVHAAKDDPTAFEGEPVRAFKHQREPIEVDKTIRLEYLPEADEKKAKKSKCSRWLNGHDVPDPLRMLDDDCGMPEPEIPCETPGNSTLCVQRMQLSPPPLPKAELMPPIPAPAYDFSNRDATPVNVSVEFIDFGVNIQIASYLGNTVGRTVELAGSQFAVDAWAIQLARSGGVDVKPTIFVHDLEDKNQLIVYLTCTYRRFQPNLIMEIPACEDLMVHNLTARVEVPSAHEVHEVFALSTERIGSVIARTPVNIAKLEKVTYDGKNVSLDTPLEEIYFRDGSAFVVYPEEPCPSHTPSPSITPSAQPSFSPTPSPEREPASPSPFPKKIKERKEGAYDVYRHCRNARGDKIIVPSAESLGLNGDGADPEGRGDDPNFECEESDMTEPEEEDFHDVGAKREPYEAADPGEPTGPMEKKATIIAEFEGREIPVRIKPIAKGIDIFDAIKLATGKEHSHMIIKYNDVAIDHFTPLRPFGFKDGDHVQVFSPTRPADQAGSVQGKV